ncbi:MAG: response regulator transcription factor, partial [Candidatus Eremiobacteraeota bacterium]|nr:response regulator transcription factor [Candidatus Eremiobacteraeota bacterium]
QARSEAPGIGALTPRELDILTMMAQGNTNRAIAEQLHLAEITIKKQAQSLMRKLGVNDRTQAAVLAVQLGLIDA